ncbi:MAG: hypothetical protein M1151_00680 [Candidatus Thermoplasmatota archaeon]|nr:hypothetical protein [Candidatus Thermoplasmatota archaeon]MCL5785169.1 hypothetical protein [Candidatus Thermoplasmatota archaeon]
MDQNPIQFALNKAKQYSFEDLSLMIGCIYHWNGYGAQRPLYHLLLSELADLCPLSGEMTPTLEDALNLINTFSDEYNKYRSEKLSSHIFSDQEGDDVEELTISRIASESIINPDSEARLMEYILDKFQPIDQLLFEKLGFRTRDLLRTIRYIEILMQADFLDYNEIELPIFKMRRGSPDHYKQEWEIPPYDFYIQWKRSNSFDLENEYSFLRPETKSVFRFLSSSQAAFSTKEYAFRRWAFLKKEIDTAVLLDPTHLANTLLTAVHIGLLNSVTQIEKGRYLESIGKQFEEMIANSFRQAYPFATINPNKKYPGQVGDTDIEVTLEEDFCILAQCKSNQLIQKNAKKDDRTFAEFYNKSVLRAAQQAKESLEFHPNAKSVKSVFIIIDSYLPGIFVLQGRSGDTYRALKELPSPIVMNYFDFKYLLYRIPFRNLARYLEWRDKVISLGILILYDEYDLIRFYLKTVEEGLEEQMLDLFKFGAEKGLPPKIIFIGYDEEWETEGFASLDLKLGLF